VGLRLALGGICNGQIVKQFSFRAWEFSFLGCIAGSVLAAAFAHVLSGMLYGVSPTDATTLLGVVLLVLVVDRQVASLAPAIRAASVEPMQVAARRIDECFVVFGPSALSN